ncbi:MAG: hypothetical protein EOM41_08465 [Bacilli bacterium]|nr:hypothetical protein [Bacilli bacterium]
MDYNEKLMEMMGLEDTAGRAILAQEIKDSLEVDFEELETLKILSDELRVKVLEGEEAFKRLKDQYVKQFISTGIVHEDTLEIDDEEVTEDELVELFAPQANNEGEGY